MSHKDLDIEIISPLKLPSSLENFSYLEAIISKNVNLQRGRFPPNLRKKIVNEILRQYSEDLLTPPKDTIELLSLENTFLCVSGHQMYVSGGPLFVFYKIVATIAFSSYLKLLFANKYNFVPVFFIHTEDHDFIEISRFHFLEFSAFISENIELIPAGNLSIDIFKPTISLIIQELRNLPYFVLEEIKKIYNTSQTLRQFVRNLCNYLFSKYGLLIIDPYTPFFKKLGQEVFLKEIQEFVIEKSLNEYEGPLEISTKKRINLFYLSNGKRLRIQENKNNPRWIQIRPTGEEIEINEFVKIANERPESLSPGVLLSPVYRCYILPVVAFVGGPHEVIYWQQVYHSFKYFNLEFPCVLQRPSCLIITPYILENLKKYNLDVREVLDNHQNLEEIILSRSGQLLPEFEKKTKALLENMGDFANFIQQSLPNFFNQWEITYTRTHSIIRNLREHLIRKLKKQDKALLKDVEIIRNFFIPVGNLQERYYHFISFPQLLQNDFIKYFIDKILESFTGEKTIT